MRSPLDTRRTGNAPWRTTWATPVLAVCVSVASAQQTTATKPEERACAFYTGLSYVYDTNIDHSQPGLKTSGGLAGFGGECGFGSSAVSLDLEYDGVVRHFISTDIWNVPGHDMRLLFAGRVAPHVYLGSAMEFAVNGSSEDRVLRDEYSWGPVLEYRINRSNRLQLYGEYLVKNYPNPLGHDEFDPRVGARFQQRLGEWSWSVSGRYEANRADSMRYHYNGPMLGVGLTNPMPGGGRLESAVRYRIRQFIARRVTIGTTEVLRRDSDWVATVAWHQLVG